MFAIEGSAETTSGRFHVPLRCPSLQFIRSIQTPVFGCGWMCDARSDLLDGAGEQPGDKSGAEALGRFGSLLGEEAPVSPVLGPLARVVRSKPTEIQAESFYAVQTPVTTKFCVLRMEIAAVLSLHAFGRPPVPPCCCCCLHATYSAPSSLSQPERKPLLFHLCLLLGGHRCHPAFGCFHARPSNPTHLLPPFSTGLVRRPALRTARKKT